MEQNTEIIPFPGLTPEASEDFKGQLPYLNRDFIVYPQILEGVAVWDSTREVGEQTVCEIDSKIGEGGGSYVYRGTTKEGKLVAVKIAFPVEVSFSELGDPAAISPESLNRRNFTEKWVRALLREAKNLQKLSPRDFNHYFPRVLYVNPSTPLFVKGLGKSRSKLKEHCLLVFEYIPPEEYVGLHDLVLEWSEVYSDDEKIETVMPELVALEIGRQYAHMLTILQEVGLSTVDRKLVDIRWKMGEVDLRDLSATTLGKYRVLPPDNVGELKVWDWNVTGGASPEETALDVLVMGRHWCRLLLGKEPQFRIGEGWILETPLEDYERFSKLSRPMQRILERFFDPEKGYKEPREVLDDINKALALWRENPESLWQKLKGHYEKYIEDYKRGKVTAPPEEVEAVLDAATVLKSEIDEWGEVEPEGFDKVFEMVERPGLPLERRELMKALEEEYIRGNWQGIIDKALSGRKMMEGSTPSQRLQLELYKHLALLYLRLGRKRDDYTDLARNALVILSEETLGKLKEHANSLWSQVKRDELEGQRYYEQLIMLPFQVAKFCWHTREAKMLVEKGRKEDALYQYRLAYEAHQGIKEESSHQHILNLLDEMYKGWREKMVDLSLAIETEKGKGKLRVA